MVFDNKNFKQTELLRLTTAGSVDDGKSTLIGRLLFDCQAIYEDQLSSIVKISQQRGLAEVDLSLLTDGLAAEREQLITIDVAYRYLSIPGRRIIIADVPGHEQYTRNMVTGAAGADVALILIDARHGLLTQSKRHLSIASLLGIPHILIVVNKMDVVGYSQQVFEKIKKDIIDFSGRLNIQDLRFMPLSALKGDMLVKRGKNLNWHQGETLLEYLQNLQLADRHNSTDLRFPVQLVVRPDQSFRGYAGKIESGSIKKGDEIIILPSRQQTKINSIFSAGREVEEATAPESVILTLADKIDVSRGDMIAKKESLPSTVNVFEAIVCWFFEQPLKEGQSYFIKQTTKTTRCFAEKINYRLDINNLSGGPARQLSFNEIGGVKIKTIEPLMVDPYARNRQTGSFILIDELTNQTVGAGLVAEILSGKLSASPIFAKAHFGFGKIANLLKRFLS
ncbi:MAG: Sulfate adenylyltransferase subunit 1 [Parcubacteria group bacterium GW2011_GWC2_42_6]|nr:MAG: Sulfate adenylyltransferase subunit 1 [Parcubacteria group bacterium GW2011_GWA2_42_11]KKS66911.1 MAG: Sulfate adenylyltransferase subunit 1 [Parcubacteria group bacterium GW2011_GWC2_42_6]